MKNTLYHNYLKTLSIGLGSAFITIALSFLPFSSDYLQALWVLISTTYVATLSLKRRLNEDDETRFERLYKERVRLWSEIDPAVLKAAFSQNLTELQIEWLSKELDTSLDTLDEIHVLDSLARVGDRPGQMGLRAALLLGKWSAEIKTEDPLEGYREQLQAWSESHLHLLGEEIEAGLFVREIKIGEHRPVGVHLIYPRSQLLFTYEEVISSSHSETPYYSIALSADASLTQQMSDEEWASWYADLLQAFPMFQRIQKGSGPQKREVPYFIQPRVKHTDFNLEEMIPHLKRLHLQLKRPESEDSSQSHESR